MLSDRGILLQSYSLSPFFLNAGSHEISPRNHARAIVRTRPNHLIKLGEAARHFFIAKLLEQLCEPRAIDNRQIEIPDRPPVALLPVREEMGHEAAAPGHTALEERKTAINVLEACIKVQPYDRDSTSRQSRRVSRRSCGRSMFGSVRSQSEPMLNPFRIDLCSITRRSQLRSLAKRPCFRRRTGG